MEISSGRLCATGLHRTFVGPINPHRRKESKVSKKIEIENSEKNLSILQTLAWQCGLQCEMLETKGFFRKTVVFNLTGSESSVQECKKAFKEASKEYKNIIKIS